MFLVLLSFSEQQDKEANMPCVSKTRPQQVQMKILEHMWYQIGFVYRNLFKDNFVNFQFMCNNISSVHTRFLVGFVLLDLQFCVYVLQIVVCPFVIFPLAIVLSVILQFTDYDYPFGIFKLFLCLLLGNGQRYNQNRY